MIASFYVFLGAGIGGVLRHLFNVGCGRLFGGHFPFGTLGVNIIGSFVIGLAAAWFAFRGSGGVS
ncbi:MAG: fluoride efflux transporter CrcB, partial [Beijerinckiaceae bacterium]